MVKLDRISRPQELTDEVIRIKTEQFRNNSKALVWNERYIKDRLLSMSYGKCCYCECDLTIESNYMEVEHFRDKHTHPDLVVDWDNLLPSCKKCNSSKSSHDVDAEPIINPCIDVPQQHMRLYHGVYFQGIDAMGLATIDVLNLNDTNRHLNPRAALGYEIYGKMKNFCNKSRDLLNNDSRSGQAVSRLRNEVTRLFQGAQIDKEYSAIAATWILNDPDYANLKDNLKALSVWTDELDGLEVRLSLIAYSEC